MARIDGVPEGRGGPLVRVAYWMSRRRVGQVTGPLAVAARHLSVMLAYGGFEYWIDRARTVDPRLKNLASLKAASMVGCPF